MGMFDFMLSPEKKIAKHVRRLTNRDSQPEDREASAAWLANQGTPQAILGMLSRFDMSLDHQLKDHGEKDQLSRMIAELGEPAIQPTQVWLKRCKSVARPLALLEHLVSEEAAIQAAFEILDIEREQGNDFKPRKKNSVLIWLAERRHEQAIERVAPFLDDFDEGVRYAAIEVLAAQKSEDAVLPLVAVLLNPEEDSNRLRVRICEVFSQRRWSLGEAAADLTGSLPDGFAVSDGRIVSR